MKAEKEMSLCILSWRVASIHEFIKSHYYRFALLSGLMLKGLGIS